MQNIADVCWEVADFSTNLKKRPEIGFSIGSVAELREQAKQGGVRLPGCAFPVAGEKKVRVSHDLRQILRPDDRLRIGKRTCRVNPARSEAVSKTHIHLRFCWLGQSEQENGLRMYRIPPQAHTSKLWTISGREAYENQLTQGFIKRYRGYHSALARYQLATAQRLRRLIPDLADRIEKLSMKHHKLQSRIKLWTVEWQYVLEAREKKKERDARGNDAQRGT